MGIFQLLFKKGSFISTVELDAIMVEGAQATSRITENPVEDGANVNDHIIIEPMTFSLEGIVSNTRSSLLSNIIALGSFFSRKDKRSTEAWQDLLKLQADRKPFTLVQGLKSYKNIVILSLQEQQDKDTSNGLFFTATMKEIIFVGTKTVSRDQFNESGTADKMEPSKTGGLKQTGGPR